MTADTVSRLVDRLGAPMAILMLLGYVVALAIKGPGMRLAETMGTAFGALCKSGVDYLGQATERLNTLPGHISLEAANVREHVTREGAAVREHVSEEVRALRDRVSGAENEISRTVTETGRQTLDSLSGATPATGIPITPKP